MTRQLALGVLVSLILRGKPVKMKRSQHTILISEVTNVASRLGFSNVKPMVLRDAGNLIVHLCPFPIVARVATLSDGDDPNFWRTIWRDEIKVATHLMKQGIPVVPYLRIMPPGPYFVGGTWMTLWEYIEPAPIPKLSILEIVGMINELVTAMSDFQEPLPALGAWRNVGQAADFVSSIRDDDRIARLLAAYEDVNERIGSEALYPAHGDAHQGNLLASSTGWQWIDFEDVSLMPKF